MNKKLFIRLLFREFYIARRLYGISLLIYALTVSISLLALLSYKCGNLYQYSYLLDEGMKSVIDKVIMLLPVFMAAYFFGCAMDFVSYDEKIGWRAFRLSCPATPFQLALAKYSHLLLALLISNALTFGWLGLHYVLTGTAISRSDISIILAIYSVMVFFIISIINIIICFRGSELALLFSLPIVLGPLLFIASIDYGFLKLIDLWGTLMPFSPLFILAMFLLGLLCTTLFYGRREK